MEKEYTTHTIMESTQEEKFEYNLILSEVNYFDERNIS